MTDNARRVCQSLMREINLGHGTVDIFYVAYSASLPCVEAIRAMDEIAALGGVKKTDYKTYELLDIKRLLSGKEGDLTVFDADPPKARPKGEDMASVYAKTSARIREIVSAAEERQRREEERKRELEEAVKKFDERKKMFEEMKIPDTRKKDLRKEEVIAASTLIQAAKKILAERYADALCYPIGKFAEKFISSARGGLIFEKSRWDTRVYVAGLEYSTGEQVAFRLVHYKGITYLGDERFLTNKIRSMKNCSTTDAEKVIKGLIENNDYAYRLFEVRAPSSEETALADIIGLYNFIQTAIDGLL